MKRKKIVCPKEVSNKQIVYKIKRSTDKKVLTKCMYCFSPEKVFFKSDSPFFRCGLYTSMSTHLGKMGVLGEEGQRAKIGFLKYIVGQFGLKKFHRTLSLIHFFIISTSPWIRNFFIIRTSPWIRIFYYSIELSR